jgi:pilus assembly protein CpaD
MMMVFKGTTKIAVALTLFVSAVALSGCEMHSPTTLTEKKIQLEKTSFSEEVLVKDMDAAYIAAAARHHNRHGDGPVNMIIAYDPASTQNTAMKASHEASRLTDLFRKEGVSGVQANIIPVQNLGEDAKALISYVAYNALPPEDCETMPGYARSDKVEASPDYRLGCTMQTAMSKQVARPRDLAGGEGVTGITDGRRAANISAAYRAGIQNEALGGESATGQ